MKNKTLFFEYVSDYLNIYLPKQLGKSEYTIKSYRDNLTIFRRYSYEVNKKDIKHFYVEDITKDYILNYIEYLRNNNRTNKTINHHISAIKGYLYYIADRDISFQSIAISISRIPVLREAKRERECLTNEQLQLFFNFPKNSKKGIRNRTLLIMLYETAMRVGEIINLKTEDLFLNCAEPYCLVHGKGDKERVVGLSSKAIEHLNYYLKLFHSHNESEYVFYSIIKNNVGQLSESTIETFIQKIADELRKEYPSIPNKVYPHMFRRTRATHLYQDNIPLELVSRMLGHSNIETTKIYAKPSIEMLRNAIEKENDVNVQPEWNSEDELAKLFGLR